MHCSEIKGLGFYFFKQRIFFSRKAKKVFAKRAKSLIGLLSNLCVQSYLLCLQTFTQKQ